MGSLVGLAVADALGHPLEFIDVASESGQGIASFSLAEKLAAAAASEEEELPPAAGGGDMLLPPPRRTRPTLRGYVNPMNQFALEPGQWTDDTSMALCMADSLIRCGRFDGSDMRLTFWSWWYCGLNNAFRKDFTRTGSVGLGGNISRSLATMVPGEVPTPAYEANTPDAGNGSLMRLCPIALFHRAAETSVLIEEAKRSSLTTHPGPIAAEASGFLAYLIVAAMARFDPLPAGRAAEDGSASGSAARAFLIRIANEYISLLGARAPDPGVGELLRLLRADEPEGGRERCWNWRSPRLDIGATMRARGTEYNGYPNSANYFGSYCLDGLAMALHSVAMTGSFDAAVERCVNLLGDADSTGAICGQIAGAMYGYRAIHPVFRSNLHKWDDGQIALRAALLVGGGVQGEGTAAPHGEAAASAGVVAGASASAASASAAAPGAATGAATAAAAGAADSGTSTTHIILGAEASKTVQALIGTYGFDLERSVEAVQALGDSCGDVGLALDWLLAHGEEDKGGAVEFCHCPHLDHLPRAPDPPLLPNQPGGKRKAVATPSTSDVGGRPLLAPSRLTFGRPCARGCTSSENWLCLECGVTSCGRYVNKHAVAHHQETGHTPSASLADLSVWCYLCDGYVHHPRLEPLVQRLQALKFGSSGGGDGGGSGSGGGGSDGDGQMV